MDVQPLPTSKQDAFVASPLYTTFSLDGWDDGDLVKFSRGGGTLDAWCANCERPSVFKIQSKLPSYGEAPANLPYSGILEIAATCTRDTADGKSTCESPLYVLFFKEYKKVRKVGQTPSAADLALESLDAAFSKELDARSRRELGTAIGLHSHGVGIGSFVYLRRIFESLLEGAHVQARSEATWDEAQYAKARVPGRIQLLSSHLPARLVASSRLYSLLSVGIHELSEQACLDSFEVVQSAIELILKERHEEKRYDSVIKMVGAKPSKR